VQTPLYRRILGASFDTLPLQLRELHGSCEPRTWRGQADVRHGGGVLARVIRALIGFPEAGSDVPLSVAFSPTGEGEHWTRTFDGKAFHSYQSPGKGRDARLLDERFGLATFALALVVDGERLLLIPRRWSLLGIPMSAFLLPRGVSFEHEIDGRFCFDVEISAPFVGLIVGYRGSLVALAT
jgi:hypothetical protein